MGRKLAILLIGFVALAIIAYELLNTNFYSLEQLDEAREQAVELARQGDYDLSLKRFEVLIKYDKDNAKLWADYLTVLEWAGRYADVQNNLEKFSIEQAPSYLLQSLTNSVHGLHNSRKPEKAKLFAERLSRSARFKQSQYYQQLTPYLPANLSQQKIQQPATVASAVIEISAEPIDQPSEAIANPVAANTELSEPKQKQEELQEKPVVNTAKPIIENKQSLLLVASNKKKEKKQQQVNNLEPRPITLVELPKTRQQYNLWSALAKEKYQQPASLLQFYQQKSLEYPNSEAIKIDYITLLSWQEEYQQSIAEYSANPNLNYPEYALLAIAKAAKERSKYNLAESLYLKILSTNPKHIDAQLGLAALEVEQENFAQAKTILQRVLAQNEKNEQTLSLLAYVLNKESGSELNKIALYDQMLAIEPENHEIKQLKVLNLIDLGLLEPASELLKENPALYDEAVTLSFAEKKNTMLIRRFIDAEPKDFEVLSSKALEANSNYLSLLHAKSQNTQPADYSISRRLNFAYADSLLLLNRTEQHQAVIKQYGALKDKLTQLPQYAIANISDSLQVLQQPEASLDIASKRIEQEQKQGNEVSSALLKTAYYAAMDVNAIKLAENYLQTLVQSQAPWKYSKNSNRKKLNDQYADMKLMQQMHKAYMSELQAAQKGIENLLEIAPANSEFKTNLSTVYRWRGWYDKSQQEIETLRLSEQDYLPLEVNSAYNLISKQDYQPAEELISQLTTRYPYQASVRRLNEDWQIANAAILRGEMSGANNSGSAFSSRDRNYQLQFESPIIANDWRLLANTSRVESQFFASDENISSTGFGVSYSKPWGSLVAQLYDVNNKSGTEYSVGFNHRLSDYWQYSLAYESFSRQTPVRAFVTDVFASSVNAALNYRVSELEEYSLVSSWSDFTDGNTRSTLGLSGRQNLFNNHTHRLDILEYVYYEKNSADSDRFYFNPQSLSSISVSLEYQGLLWKSGNRNFKHRAGLELGLLSQRDFSSGLVWNAEYGHLWQLSKKASLYYNLGYAKHLYDGQSETGPNFSLGFEVRF